MAEGAIEGSAEMYEVPSGDAVNFVFSRFHVKRLEAAGGLLLPAGEAAGVESGETGGTRFAAGPDVEASLGRPSRRLARLLTATATASPTTPFAQTTSAAPTDFSGRCLPRPRGSWKPTRCASSGGVTRGGSPESLQQALCLPAINLQQ